MGRAGESFEYLLPGFMIPGHMNPGNSTSKAIREPPVNKWIFQCRLILSVKMRGRQVFYRHEARPGGYYTGDGIH
jgi:hypothetical protein